MLDVITFCTASSPQQILISTEFTSNAYLELQVYILRFHKFYRTSDQMETLLCCEIVAMYNSQSTVL